MKTYVQGFLHFDTRSSFHLFQKDERNTFLTYSRILIEKALPKFLNIISVTKGSPWIVLSFNACSRNGEKRHPLQKYECSMKVLRESHSVFFFIETDGYALWVSCKTSHQLKHSLSLTLTHTHTPFFHHHHPISVSFRALLELRA